MSKGEGVEDKQEVRELMESLLKLSCRFEGMIYEASAGIREKSKTAYGSDLLDARLLLMGAFAHLSKIKDAIPGKTNESISHRLVLQAAFFQGATVTESLISEGQYSKAAAVLKQDYEILARIGETRAGVAKAGKTPNARYAPEGSQFMYGELNKVAHPSNKELTGGLLGNLSVGEIEGVSSIPAFREKQARALYSTHVFTLLHAVREAVQLYSEMYDTDADKKLALPAIQGWVTAVGFLERAGVIIEEKGNE